MGWWNAGVATVADIRFAGNGAIRRHHDETDLVLTGHVADWVDAASEDCFTRP